MRPMFSATIARMLAWNGVFKNLWCLIAYKGQIHPRHLYSRPLRCELNGIWLEVLEAQKEKLKSKHSPAAHVSKDHGLITQQFRN